MNQPTAEQRCKRILRLAREIVELSLMLGEEKPMPKLTELRAV